MEVVDRIPIFLSRIPNFLDSPLLPFLINASTNYYLLFIKPNELNIRVSFEKAF